jgi:hypothetical protein
MPLADGQTTLNGVSRSEGDAARRMTLWLTSATSAERRGGRTGGMGSRSTRATAGGRPFAAEFGKFPDGRGDAGLRRRVGRLTIVNRSRSSSGPELRQEPRGGRALARWSGGVTKMCLLLPAIQAATPDRSSASAAPPPGAAYASNLGELIASGSPHVTGSKFAA